MWIVSYVLTRMSALHAKKHIVDDYDVGVTTVGHSVGGDDRLTPEAVMIPHESSDTRRWSI